MKTNERIIYIIKSELEKQKMKLGTLARLAKVDNGNLYRFINQNKPRSIRVEVLVPIFRELKISLALLDETGNGSEQ